jgi:hypothetical protein
VVFLAAGQSNDGAGESREDAVRYAYDINETDLQGVLCKPAIRGENTFEGSI